jgi:glutamate racemase
VSDAPIGIFDSGVGGLTVARSVRDQLPRESILYVGDTAHTPYGPKPLADVRRYALEVLDDLVEQNVKMLVIACNTASAAMLRDARERYDVAFAAAPHLELFSQACPEFVEHVEAGDTTSPELVALAERYLTPLVDQGIDTLVLGCTHYPFLKGAISYVVGEGVRLVSSDTETANDVYRTLVRTGLARTSPTPPEYRYEATGGSAQEFKRLSELFLGPEVSQVKLVETGAIPIPHPARRTS